MVSVLSDIRTVIRRVTVRELAAIVAVTLLAFGVRLSYVYERQVLPPPDTYEHIDAGRALTRGTYPFAERHLPLYQLLVGVGESLGADPVGAATVISLLASVATLPLLYLLGRRFGLPQPFLLGALTLPLLDLAIAGQGTRPLSDSLFLFGFLLALLLTISARPSPRWAMGTGITFGFFLATRYEALPIVLVLLFCLRLRTSWKFVGQCAALTGLLILPWALFLTRMYGVPWRTPYASIVSLDPRYGVRSPAHFAESVAATFENSGWSTPWRNAERALVAATEERGVARPLALLGRDPFWWLGLIGILGVIWLLFRRPREMLPVAGAFALLFLLVSASIPIGRVATPLRALHALAVAGGLSALWHVSLHILGGPRIVFRPAVALVGLSVLGIGLLRSLPILRTVDAVRIDHNGSGAALVEAIRNVSEAGNQPAFSFSMLASGVLLGSDTAPTSQPPRALMLDHLLGRPPESILVELRARGVTGLFDDGDPWFAPVLARLRAEKRITGTEEFRAAAGTPDENLLTLYRLSWN